MTTLKPYFTLCRIYIALFSACSAAAGYLLASRDREAGALIPAAAVFLLACGASALNQFQERNIDARMERTRKRPLPAGTLSPYRALALSLLLIAAGLLILASAGGVKPLILGSLSILWYNGVYTMLKKVTAFASIPGAAVGMIPPAVGWISADGLLLDARLTAVCFIVFMWQIPHFWLLLLNHGEEYERAGLPSLTAKMNTSQIARITFVWIVAASIGTLALPLYGSIRSPLACLTLVPLAGWVIWNGKTLIHSHSLLPASPVLFRKINLYLLLIMILLSLDSMAPRLP